MPSRASPRQSAIVTLEVDRASTQLFPRAASTADGFARPLTTRWTSRSTDLRRQPRSGYSTCGATSTPRTIGVVNFPTQVKTDRRQARRWPSRSFAATLKVGSTAAGSGDRNVFMLCDLQLASHVRPIAHRLDVAALKHDLPATSARRELPSLLADARRRREARRGRRLHASGRAGYATVRYAGFRLSGYRHYGDHASPPDDRSRVARRVRARRPSATPRSRRCSGEPIKPLYTEADLAGGGQDEDYDGRPGVYPFTRGVYPSMYRGRLWTMRQFAGFGTAEETNERFRYLLDHGQNGLSTAFDMPSLMGHDSDHVLSEGEVGREGVAVDTLDDMADAVRRHRPRRDLASR